ncbi:MAG TPA: Gfo/Idh/MocA family oxidoreductase [Pseudonocardiaceae bacterium]|jgi:myo-inositol 2-dehydrogenase/D-chiro-inositol 1-dehydrogenase|nr:Gfo/Idh/MocA family oxidoreductase [Pseudonocardiaceae bacterium]
MTVKVGVIGTGNIGRDHINRLHTAISGASVVAVTDLDPTVARSVADGVGARLLPSAADVIGAPEVDAVLVTSWGPSHEEYVLAAIAAGKPVFCEKPLATTADACLRIVDAEVAHGSRLVQVGFMRRYDAGYRAIKQTLSAGRIGPALMVHCAHRNPTASVGHYSTDMVITDTAIHEIDVLRWLLAEDFAFTRVLRPRRSSLARPELVDPQIVLLETVSGVHIDVEVYVNCRFGYDIRCEVVCETGTVSLADAGPVAVRAAGSVGTSIPPDWQTRFVDAYDTEIQEWVDGVAAGVADGPSAWDGYVASVTTDACLAAQSGGERVGITLPERPVFYPG